MNRKPLAELMRPKKLRDVVGHNELIGNSGILTQLIKTKDLTSLIFWGPPGSGKTTLARIIASEVSGDFIELSAVTSGKKDIEKVVEHARQNWNLKIRTILFVDEIHRFNKAQQDAFLPHVESGLITLIGATTENPSFEVINPLLSRSKVLILGPLQKTDIIKLIKRALKTINKTKHLNTAAIDYLAELSAGDARTALNTLELALSLSDKVTKVEIETAAGKKLPGYDKNGDKHYNLISAFIKSMRGGSIDGATYYLARMLQAGEDPKFIARRLIIFASEDIGLAGNGALGLAVACFQSVERIGLPEANYALFHTTMALAKSQKSREVTNVMNEALEKADKFPSADVPLHLRNAPTKLMKDLGYGKDYKWESGHQPKSEFLPKELL